MIALIVLTSVNILNVLEVSSIMSRNVQAELIAVFCYIHPSNLDADAQKK